MLADIEEGMALWPEAALGAESIGMKRQANRAGHEAQNRGRQRVDALFIS